MKNWKELVGYQPNTDVASWLDYEKYNLVIKKEKLLCELEEKAVIENLNNIFNSFTTKVNKENIIEIEQAKINSYKKTKRGIPNTQWDNVFYYKGNINSDSPVIVTEYNGKYAILLHPNFDDFGFAMAFF